MGLVTRQGKGSRLTIQEMDNNLEYLNGFKSLYKGLTQSNINWSDAETQEFELSGDTTFSFSGSLPGSRLNLILKQLRYDVTWPDTVKWVKSQPVTNTDYKVINFYYNGTYYIGDTKII